MLFRFRELYRRHRASCLGRGYAEESRGHRAFLAAGAAVAFYLLVNMSVFRSSRCAFAAVLSVIVLLRFTHRSFFKESSHGMAV